MKFETVLCTENQSIEPLTLKSICYYNSGKSTNYFCEDKELWFDVIMSRISAYSVSFVQVHCLHCSIDVVIHYTIFIFIQRKKFAWYPCTECLCWECSKIQTPSSHVIADLCLDKKKRARERSSVHGKEKGSQLKWRLGRKVAEKKAKTTTKVRLQCDRRDNIHSNARLKSGRASEKECKNK